MEFKDRLRNDLWKYVHAHYDGKDYTESVRDSLLFVCDLLREKSGIIDKDGTKLIDDTLLGKTPVILVNKNETTTEKDIQQGIGFMLKGLINKTIPQNSIYNYNSCSIIFIGHERGFWRR